MAEKSERWRPFPLRSPVNELYSACWEATQQFSILTFNFISFLCDVLMFIVGLENLGMLLFQLSGESKVKIMDRPEASRYNEGKVRCSASNSGKW